MTTVVWITGRAATGKSTVLTACLDQLHSTGQRLVLCDEELLFQLKRADTTHSHHYHPHGDHRFAFRDGYLFDEGLRRISTITLAAIQTGAADVVLVELARGSAVQPVDLTWRHALDLIDPRIWPHSLVFRLDAPVHFQLDRNRHRTTDGQPHTPEQILCSLYANDDPDSLTGAGITVHPIPHTMAPDQAASLVINTLDRTTAMRRCHQAATAPQQAAPAPADWPPEIASSA
jgi:hypothetical protein